MSEAVTLAAPDRTKIAPRQIARHPGYSLAIYTKTITSATDSRKVSIGSPARDDGHIDFVNMALSIALLELLPAPTKSLSGPSLGLPFRAACEGGSKPEAPRPPRAS